MSLSQNGMAASAIAMPAELLKSLKVAGATFEDTDPGDNMIVASSTSQAYALYKTRVQGLPAELSDPLVGCFVLPSAAIATSTIAPQLALYGFIQVRDCSGRDLTLLAE